MDFLRKFFDMWIFLKNLRPSCHPDLSPCDSFFWGYVKDKVVVHNLTSIEELKVKSTEVIHSIDVQLLQKVSQNLLKWLKWTTVCHEVKGNLLFYFDFILFPAFCNIAFSINPLVFFWDLCLCLIEYGNVVWMLYRWVNSVLISPTVRMVKESFEATPTTSL